MTLYSEQTWSASKHAPSNLVIEINKSTQKVQTSYHLIAWGPNLESQHGDLDHPQNLINCSLYHCKAVLKFSKSAHNLLSNDLISNLAVNMVIHIAAKI